MSADSTEGLASQKDVGQKELFLLAVEKSDCPFQAQKSSRTFRSEKMGCPQKRGAHSISAAQKAAPGAIARSQGRGSYSRLVTRSARPFSPPRTTLRSALGRDAGGSRTHSKAALQAAAAEANLTSRREETAAICSQANTAKLLVENPTLMRLRELEVLEKIASRRKSAVHWMALAFQELTGIEPPDFWMVGSHSSMSTMSGVHRWSRTRAQICGRPKQH
jgi:hypothetical protein